MRNLLIIIILFIGSASYGQMTKGDVITITNDAWEKSVTTVTIHTSDQHWEHFESGSEKNVETKFTNNYIEIKNYSGNIIYLPYDKIKSMMYRSETETFIIWMLNSR